MLYMVAVEIKSVGAISLLISPDLGENCSSNLFIKQKMASNNPFMS